MLTLFLLEVLAVMSTLVMSLRSLNVISNLVDFEFLSLLDEFVRCFSLSIEPVAHKAGEIGFGPVNQVDAFGGTQHQFFGVLNSPRNNHRDDLCVRLRSHDHCVQRVQVIRLALDRLQRFKQVEQARHGPHKNESKVVVQGNHVLNKVEHDGSDEIFGVVHDVSEERECHVKVKFNLEDCVHLVSQRSKQLLHNVNSIANMAC